MNKRAQRLYTAVVIVILALALRVGFSAIKPGYHVDEGITLAISGANWFTVDKTEYSDRWMTVRDLQVKAFDGAIVQENYFELTGGIAAETAEDVHPPLYYWLYATARLLFGAHSYLLAGVALNLAFFVLSCWLVYRISRRLWSDPVLTLLVLAAFAFSTGAVSMTLFLRMYELLQTVCLLFLYSAVCILYPAGGKRTVVPVIGLFVSSLLGLLTHYYFLFFIFPILLFSLVSLVRSGRIALLLWCMLLILSGLYGAYRIFPALADHLLSSYRAVQGLTSLREAGISSVAWKLWLYLGVLMQSLTWPCLFGLLPVLALIAQKKIPKQAVSDSHIDSRKSRSLCMCVGSALFLFTILAIISPYQSARYVVAFFPLFIFAFVALLNALADAPVVRAGTGIMGFAVILALCLPPHVLHFHEDYYTDADPVYMRDERPVIIISTPEQSGWKNMVLFPNLNEKKRVYVTEQNAYIELDAIIKKLAQGSGSDVAYAVIDDFYVKKPQYRKVGYYGFFDVYEVPVTRD